MLQLLVFFFANFVMGKTPSGMFMLLRGAGHWYTARHFFVPSKLKHGSGSKGNYYPPQVEGKGKKEGRNDEKDPRRMFLASLSSLAQFPRSLMI